MLRILRKRDIILAACLVAVTACKLVAPLKAPRRLGSKDTGLVIQESISLERSADGSTLTLSFETREAASCKIGFYVPSTGKASSETPTPCASSSATKFTETLTGVPKDQLITAMIKIWPSRQSESASVLVSIPEALPSAGENNINLLLVDMGAGRLDLSSISANMPPSELIARSIGIKTQQCALSDAVAQANPVVKGPLLLQGATSRGFINATTSRASPTVLGGSFLSAQRESSEWNVTARSSAGFGRLRIAKPTLMASAIFSGRDQSQGTDDALEDIDPPAIKLAGGSSMVASWTLSGDPKGAVATLTIAPSGSFPGITCSAPAANLKITIPQDLVAKIPANNRIWSSLRIDSWQALDKERWAVRVSDWKSMGVQRL